jgi:hypothetical protein
MRYLVRFVSSETPHENFLASVRVLARSVGGEARNPKWTSHGALEVDIFCPSRADFDLFLSASGPLYDLEFYRDLNEAPPHKSEEAQISEARDMFNHERYWECHEVLEGVWRLKDGVEKRFLQGLILVCAAFVHHQKGEEAVALSILRRASRQLDYPKPDYHGFKGEDLSRNVQEILQSGNFSNFRV